MLMTREITTTMTASAIIDRDAIRPFARLLSVTTSAGLNATRFEYARYT